MTKKEFIDAINDVSDDVEIVFATDRDLRGCVPLNALNVSFIRQCVNAPDDGGQLFMPQYRSAIVIDAVPYPYLERVYHMTFSAHGKHQG